MRSLFERTMSLEDYVSLYKGNPPVLITSYGALSKAVDAKLDSPLTIELKHSIDYTNSSSTSADIVDYIEVYQNALLVKTLNCINDLEPYLIETLPDDTAVFIDISNMGVRLLAIVLSSLAFALEKKPEIPAVFCGYAEPEAYHRRGILTKKGDGAAQFELYSDFAPIAPLPNFVSIGSNDSKQLWVVLLGFEGYRTDIIDDDLSRIDDIIALVTIPSLRLGWSNYAITENAYFLRGVDRKVPSIECITASSPFSAYNALCELQKRYQEYRLQVSPFSTKANSLGVLLYALNFPECSVVFDNPIESSRPKETESDIYHVYEITMPLKISHLNGGN